MLKETPSDSEKGAGFDSFSLNISIISGAFKNPAEAAALIFEFAVRLELVCMREITTKELESFIKAAIGFHTHYKNETTSEIEEFIGKMDSERKARTSSWEIIMDTVILNLIQLIHDKELENITTESEELEMLDDELQTYGMLLARYMNFPDIKLWDDKKTPLELQKEIVRIFSDWRKKTGF